VNIHGTRVRGDSLVRPWDTVQDGDVSEQSKDGQVIVNPVELHSLDVNDCGVVSDVATNQSRVVLGCSVGV